MPSTDADEDKVSGGETDLPYEWRVWPAGLNPPAALVAVALTCAMVYYAYVVLQNVLFAVVAIVVMVGGLPSFWFPSHYRLDETGVRVKGLLQSKAMQWNELSCYLRGKSFIALSTADEPSERSLSQGLILRLSGNGDEVAAVLDRYLPEWKRPETE